MNFPHQELIFFESKESVFLNHDYCFSDQINHVFIQKINFFISRESLLPIWGNQLLAQEDQHSWYEICIVPVGIGIKIIFSNEGHKIALFKDSI